MLMQEIIKDNASYGPGKQVTALWDFAVRETKYGVQ